MADMTGYFSDKTDEIFRKNSIRYSVICIFIVLFLIAASIMLINLGNNALKADLHVFSTSENAIPHFSRISDGLSGDKIKIGVKSVSTDGGKVTVEIIGENCSGKDWKAHGYAFMLSSFNSRAASPRDHYYADNWEDFTVKDGEGFDITLEFTANVSAGGTNEGYIFTLSAFRDGEFPAAEIILTE